MRWVRRGNQTSYIEIYLPLKSVGGNGDLPIGGTLNFTLFCSQAKEGITYYDTPVAGSVPDGYKEIEYETKNNTKAYKSSLADKLTTARTINGVKFDGSKNINIPINDSTKLPLAGGTMTGDITLNSNIKINTNLSTVTHIQGNKGAAIINNTAAGTRI